MLVQNRCDVARENRRRRRSGGRGKKQRKHYTLIYCVLIYRFAPLALHAKLAGSSVLPLPL